MTLGHVGAIVLVTSVASVQIAAVSLFAALATSGDEYGIARSMVLLLATPLVCLTLPAFLLFRRGNDGWAIGLAILSLLAIVLLWLFA